MEELISVIVPVYKVEQYLDKCVKSIINQTYKNLEIILVDDGSPDACGKMCDDYAKSDKRIKVIHKQNGGLSSARNAGLDIATGEYIAFADSDDWLDARYIEEMLKVARESGADLVCCSVNYVSEKNEKFENMPKIEQNQLLAGSDNIFKAYYKTGLAFVLTYAWNKLYKREIFRELRFPEGYVYEDVGTVLNVLNECEKISLLSLALYNYLIRQNSIMQSSFNENKIDSKAFLFEKRIGFLEERGLSEYLKMEAEIRFNDLGSTFRQTRDKQLRKKIKAIFKENWKKYKRYIGFNKQSLKARLKKIYVQFAR